MEPRMEDVFARSEQKVAPLSSAQKEKLLAARDEGMTPFVLGCAILRAKQEQRRTAWRAGKSISPSTIFTGLSRTGSITASPLRSVSAPIGRP